MRKAFALGTVALSVLGLAATAVPAQAATGTTTVALSVVDGTLAIVTTPAAAGVNSAIVGTGRTFTAPLGLTTVTDTRAASTGWGLSASTTAFTLSGGAATIPAANATFSLTAAPTNTVGSNTYSNTATTTPSSGALTTATASGINTATMEPVLHVAVPNTAAVGLYTGTVTQSVV